MYVASLICSFDSAAALADLNEALRLSNGGGKAGCKALCQRGLLRRKLGDIDAAKDDFAKAATLGSQFARTQVCCIREDFSCLNMINAITMYTCHASRDDVFIHLTHQTTKYQRSAIIMSPILYYFSPSDAPTLRRSQLVALNPYAALCNQMLAQAFEKLA